MRGEWKETRLKSLTGASNVGHYGSQEGFQVGSFAVLSRKVMSCELIYAFEKSLWLFCACWTLGKKHGGRGIG